MQRDANQGSDGSAPNQEQPSDDSSRHYQFDWLNWFYWSLWWQQYSYWAWFQQQQQQQQGPTPGQSWSGASQQQRQQEQQQSPQDGTQLPTADQQQTQQYNQFYPYYQFNPAVTPPYGEWGNNYQGHPHAGVGGGVAQPHAPAGLLLRIRFINGYETYIASVWKRLVAELLDTIIFLIMLKAYLPGSDFRIPEVLLEGADVWKDLEEDEFEEIHQVLSVFVSSIVLQRIHHAIMESIWLVVFSCTPGKWIMGLRVLRCRAVHYTRTQPGRTVRIDPGGRLSPLITFLRSMFKATFSLFCPLLIFFFSLTRGRTKYDELFGSAVVDVRTMFRPVYSGRSQTRPGGEAGR